MNIANTLSAEADLKTKKIASYANELASALKNSTQYLSEISPLMAPQIPITNDPKIKP